jgi:hypothetical protein
MAVKWGRVAETSTGIFLSFENLQLRSSDGSGIGFLPPPPSYTYIMGYSTDNYETACELGTLETIYTANELLTNGSELWQDDYLTIPVINGYYSRLGTYYLVQDGVVIYNYSCPIV